MAWSASVPVVHIFDQHPGTCSVPGTQLPTEAYTCFFGLWIAILGWVPNWDPALIKHGHAGVAILYQSLAEPGAYSLQHA